MITTIRFWVTAIAVWAGMAVGCFAVAGSFTDTDGRPVVPLGLDVHGVQLSRTASGRIVLGLRFAAAPVLSRTRVLLDVDGKARGEASSGADYMLEGRQLYRYRQGGQGWEWDSMAPPEVLEEARTATFLLPSLPAFQDVGISVQTMDAQHAVIDRLPDEGALDVEYAALPIFVPELQFAPGDMGGLTDGLPHTLSLRHLTDVQSVLWASVTGGCPPMVWTPWPEGTSVAIRISVTDASSGKQADFVADGCGTFSNMTLSTGTVLGVGMSVLGEAQADGARVTVEVSSQTDRFLRLEIASGVNPRGWIWHDDIRSARNVDGAIVCANTAETPFGIDRRQSVYPLGVLSSGTNAVVVETDVREPRVFQISADPARSFFGITYDLAVTQGTSNFPGRAVVRCSLRRIAAAEGQAFRAAWAGLTDRSSEGLSKRPAPAKCVQLLASPTVPGGGGGYAIVGEDLTAAATLRSLGVEPLVAVEPAVCSIPLAATTPLSLGELDELLQVYSGAAGRSGELAVSARLGATRRPDGSTAAEFTPGGVRIEVSADPDIRPTPDLPISRAMSEWRLLQAILGDRSTPGVCLAYGASSADYSGAAIGVADVPCTFEPDSLKPCLDSTWSVHELARAFDARLREKDRVLAGLASGSTSPFFPVLMDLGVARASWLDHVPYERWSDAEMDRQRALWGRKPFAVIQTAASSNATPESLKRALDDCMFWGFLPGFGDAYWRNADVVKRDRPLLKSYVPVIERMAAAGWEPVCELKSEKGGLWIEQYGSLTGGLCHLTLRNPGDMPVWDLLQPQRDLPAGGVMLNPRTAEIAAGESLPVRLAGRSVITLDWIPAEDIDRERAFLRGWASGYGEAEACLRVLDSVMAEKLVGANCAVLYPVPSVTDEANEVQVRVLNTGSNVLHLTGMKVIGKVYRSSASPETSIEPGQTGEAVSWFRADDPGSNGWLEVQWVLKSDDNETVCTRMIRPPFVKPIEIVAGASSVTGTIGTVELELEARNVSTNTRALTVKWEGDFRRGAREVSADPGVATSIRVPVSSKAAGSGQVLVTVIEEGAKVFVGWFDVVFRKADE